MQEGNVQAIGTLAGSFVDKADALLVAHGQSLAHAILNLEGYVMDTATTVVEILLDGALGARGLQQLQLHLTNLHEGGLHFLVLNNFGLVNFQAQYVAEVGHNGVNRLNGDAQMLDS